jgi:hypothetical protein
LGEEGVDHIGVLGVHGGQHRERRRVQG